MRSRYWGLIQKITLICSQISGSETLLDPCLRLRQLFRQALLELVEQFVV
jgi:hypothetical protein